jgi:hypothetical protein
MPRKKKRTGADRRFWRTRLDCIVGDPAGGLLAT